MICLDADCDNQFEQRVAEKGSGVEQRFCSQTCGSRYRKRKRVRDFPYWLNKGLRGPKPYRMKKYKSTAENNHGDSNRWRDGENKQGGLAEAT